MLKKLHHDLSNETDVNISEEPVITKIPERNLATTGNSRITIMELVAIFTEEANKACKNKRIAKLIALGALFDYVNRHAKNLKFC